MKRWIDAVKSSNESAPHAEKSEDCWSKFQSRNTVFCMKLEVALNWNTDHNIYLSISPLIRKPKLFEAIWWWTETSAAKCLAWIETWKQTYCVSWESSHNQNDWSGAHQYSREYPYLSMIQGLAGFQQINQSTNHILRCYGSTSTFFFNMLQPSGLGNCYCCKWVSRAWDARKNGLLQSVSAAHTNMQSVFKFSCPFYSTKFLGWKRNSRVSLSSICFNPVIL